VDTEMVTAVANRHMKPDQLLIVIVGDRAKIEEDIRKLKVGEVSIIATK
jgi:hypothetical protein